MAPAPSSAATAGARPRASETPPCRWVRQRNPQPSPAGSPQVGGRQGTPHGVRLAVPAAGDDRHRFGEGASSCFSLTVPPPAGARRPRRDSCRAQPATPPEHRRRRTARSDDRSVQRSNRSSAGGTGVARPRRGTEGLGLVVAAGRRCGCPRVLPPMAVSASRAWTQLIVVGRQAVDRLELQPTWPRRVAGRQRPAPAALRAGPPPDTDGATQWTSNRPRTPARTNGSAPRSRPARLPARRRNGAHAGTSALRRPRAGRLPRRRRAGGIAQSNTPFTCRRRPARLVPSCAQEQIGAPPRCTEARSPASTSAGTGAGRPSTECLQRVVRAPHGRCHGRAVIVALARGRPQGVSWFVL